MVAHLRAVTEASCLTLSSGFVSVQPKPTTVRARRHSSVPLEQVAEEDDVLIADRITDLLHAAMVAFKQALGGRDAELLQVSQRTIARGLLKAADEIPQAHADPASSGVQGEVSMKVLV